MPKDATHHGRPWMRKSAAAGFALAVGATLLAGCSSDAGSAPTLTWYINPDDGGQAELAKRCTDESGGAYNIETSLLPNDAASQREQLARRDFPYCTDEVSAGIVGQINSRWPAAHHGHEHDA